MEFAAYLGIPFVLRGRDHQGTDCYGFVWMFYREQLGIELPRYEGACEIGRAPEEIQSRIEDNLNTHQWVQIPEAELRRGDIVFVKRFGFNHVGICVGMPKMIHMSKAGVVIQDLSRMGQGKIEACFRHRSVTE